MSLHIADWIGPLFFLSALVLLLKFRPALWAISRESYKCVTAGVTVLAFVALARTYYLNGLFNGLPFISEPLFYRVVSWIGILTGTILILNGVSTWLPISRSNRERNRSGKNQLEFIAKIERLAHVEQKADHLFNLALTCMYEHFALRKGVVFRYSPNRGTMFLTGSVPDMMPRPAIWRSLLVNDHAWQQFLAGAPGASNRLFDGFPESVVRPDIVLPVMIGERPIGFYLLWPSDDQPMTETDVANMKLATDVLARKIESDRLRMRSDHYRHLAVLSSSLSRAIEPRASLAKNLGSLLVATSKELELDFLSLVAVDRSGGKMIRYSVGDNGALLTEKGLPLPAGDSPILRALDSGETIIDDESHSISPADNFNRHMTGMPAVVAVPMAAALHESYLFVASTRGKGKTGQTIAGLLEALRPHVVMVVLVSDLAVDRLSAERRFASISDLLRGQHCSEDFETQCRNAALFLSDELRTCGVRISLVEPNSPFLSSVALATREEIIPDTPANGLLIRSLMPLCNRVIQSGETVIASRGGGEQLTPVEARQCFVESIQSLLLTPVRSAGIVVAVVAVGDISGDRDQTISSADIALISAVADLLAVGFTVTQPKFAWTVDRTQSVTGGQLITNMELRSRIKSSLSGIIGSVELAKASGEAHGPSLDRYLSIIDKSAHRLHQYLEPTDAEMNSEEC